MLCKWNHAGVTFWDFFFLLSISSFRSIQVIACISSLFLFITEWQFLVWMCHSSFDHSLTEGYFSWIKLLWTSAYMFLCERKFPFLWQKCPRVELLSHLVSVSYFYEKLPQSFPEWLCHCAFPAGVYEGSTPSPAFRVCFFFLCLDQGVRGEVCVLVCRLHRKSFPFLGHPRCISYHSCSSVFWLLHFFNFEITTYVIVVIDQSISND